MFYEEVRAQDRSHCLIRTPYWTLNIKLECLFPIHCVISYANPNFFFHLLAQLCLRRNRGEGRLQGGHTPVTTISNHLSSIFWGIAQIGDCFYNFYSDKDIFSSCLYSKHKEKYGRNRLVSRLKKMKLKALRVY